MHTSLAISFPTAVGGIVITVPLDCPAPTLVTRMIWAQILEVSIALAVAQIIRELGH